MESRVMTDAQRRAIALEYLRRLDCGTSVSELFDDRAQVFFPKWGVATGRNEYEKLFADLGQMIALFRHDHAYVNVVQQGDFIVIEGTSSGVTANGVHWNAGQTLAGRWCDVFEIRDFKIQRCFIYLDPDYEDADTARYPWCKP
ncbi:nuclear transport factor 2 family protein [Paraburkholderia strydomiana]|uniref:nuclear transport factor 2 family protein n=1 Tax=Paraburkholderia strydomiana TaxID=1245417 RepID=UPI001BE671B5|nr:nuclear transport factor 2 family protein [Paraburkholderia strydomiana]MBT2790080.1 nuclear transport factor 2 family protein [Paraburkholderia strydomiana]